MSTTTLYILVFMAVFVRFDQFDGKDLLCVDMLKDRKYCIEILHIDKTIKVKQEAQ